MSTSKYRFFSFRGYPRAVVPPVSGALGVRGDERTVREFPEVLFHVFLRAFAVFKTARRGAADAFEFPFRKSPVCAEYVRHFLSPRSYSAILIIVRRPGMPIFHMIGVFDSGFGGLTILRELRRKLPQYDFMYLGDNARHPPGSRTFETIYRYTLRIRESAVVRQGCPLVILACNTASARALRTFCRMTFLRSRRKTTSSASSVPRRKKWATFSKTGNIGILGTAGDRPPETIR